MHQIDCGDRTQRVVVTEDVAGRIHRLLVKYSKEDHNKRTAFVQTMAETGLGRDQEWWIINNGYWGITKFFMCSDEWYVITSQEDESPRTREAVDLCNLALAQLRDVIDAEQNP